MLNQQNPAAMEEDSGWSSDDDVDELPKFCDRRERNCVFFDENREKSMLKETRKNFAKKASARKMGGATDVNPSIQLVGVDFDCTLAAVDFTKI